MSPEIVYPIAALILALGIGYGLFSYLTRNKANDAVSEAATRREYDTPTRDDGEEDRPARPV
jgi:hypothetical protein